MRAGYDSMSNPFDRFGNQLGDLFRDFLGGPIRGASQEQATREKAQRECDVAIGRRVRVRVDGIVVSGTVTECAYKLHLGNPRYIYKLRVGQSERQLTLKSARIPKAVTA